MIEYGLKKAAAVSFIVHLALISATFITIGRTPSFQMPSPYTVRLISPEKSAVKALRIPPEKTEATMELKGVRAVKEPPPQKLKDYAEEKIAALMAKREQEQYKADRLSAIEAKRKLAKVKEIGEEKATVQVTATAVGEAGEATEGIIGEYSNMVRSLIEQEWIYFDVKTEDISAIITVRVFKNGELKITNIEQSSGDAIFDRSAVRAVNRASPVPPPPYEVELGVRFIPIHD
jgi:colicin import membrane protein